MSSPNLIKAFLCRRLTPVIEAALGERFNLDINCADSILSPCDIESQAKGSEVLFVTATEQINAEVITRLSPSLKVIATLSVGYDHIDLTAASAMNIHVLNTPDVLSDACAEIAILLLLNACRRGMEADRMVRTGAWPGWGPTQLLGQGLMGRKLGIFGMGRIGRAIATRAVGFGLEIHYHNRNQLNPELEAGAHYHEDLNALLQVSNIFVIAAPGSPELKKTIDAVRIALLPDGAVIINVSRGDLIDDDALIAALRSKKLFAAGLDVFDHEPKVDPRYRTLDNTFLTPHIGSATEQTRNAMGWLLIDGLQALAEGKKPSNLVI